MDWHLIVPAAKELAGMDFSRAREVRLRCGAPIWVLFPEGAWQGRYSLTREDVHLAAQALSGHGLAAESERLSQGFLPLPGGHRLGICGRMGPGGMREISSLCLRMAHEIKGVGAALFPRIQGKNTLILGPPGTGKTTLLRDLVRLYSSHGFQVGVADERGEIAACQEGAPQLDVGSRTDVITGMEKGSAMTLLLRSMAPQVLATDELGGAADARAVMEALHSGVILLATLHAKSVAQAWRRPAMAGLIQAGAFEKMIVLRGVGQPWEMEEEDPCD